MCTKWFVLIFMLALDSLRINHVEAKGARKLNKVARKKSLETLYSGSKASSWCKATVFEQSIRETGCETKIVQNKACVGQCFSYYSPETFPMRYASRRRRRKYCAVCKPSVKSWITVSLKCPGKNHNQVDKLVEMIYACSCKKCTKSLKHANNS